MIGCACLMLAREPAEQIGSEQTTVEGPWTEEEPLEPWTKRPAQPAGDRDGEAHLLAVENLAGYATLESAAEHSLGSPAADLVALGQGHDMLHEFVIEERHPALNGRRHTHAVLLHEQLHEVRL